MPNCLNFTHLFADGTQITTSEENIDVIEETLNYNLMCQTGLANTGYMIVGSRQRLKQIKINRKYVSGTRKFDEPKILNH